MTQAPQISGQETSRLHDIELYLTQVRLRLEPELLSLKEVERRHIASVLELLDGNKSAAARVLGVDRKTLQRKGY
jgi:ActR/RegA family two-component response regulator